MAARTVLLAALLCACAAARREPQTTSSPSAQPPPPSLPPASATIAPPAPAPVPTPPPAEIAGSLFHDGMAQIEAGAVRQGCARLEESLRIHWSLRTYLEVTECEFRAGNIEQACKDLAWAERESHTATVSPHLHQEVQERFRSHALDCE